MISVILPVFNAVQTIDSAVDSILSQTHFDLELLILDGGSDDGTIDRLYSIKDTRVKIWIDSQYRGRLGGALNFLIAQSTGEFIARMDADDISYKNRLEIQLDYFYRSPEISLLGCQFSILCEGRIYEKIVDLPINNDDIIRDLVGAKLVVAHPTVMFRKSDALKAGLYKVDGIAEDLQFYFDLSRIGEIRNTKENLFLYSTSSNSLSGSKQWYVDTFYKYTIFLFRNNMSAVEFGYADFLLDYNKFTIVDRISLKLTHIGNNFYKASFRRDEYRRIRLLLLLMAVIFKPRRALSLLFLRVNRKRQK